MVIHRDAVHMAKIKMNAKLILRPECKNSPIRPTPNHQPKPPVLFKPIQIWQILDKSRSEHYHIHDSLCYVLPGAPGTCLLEPTCFFLCDLMPAQVSIGPEHKPGSEWKFHILHRLSSKGWKPKKSPQNQPGTHRKEMLHPIASVGFWHFKVSTNALSGDFFLLSTFALIQT